MMWIEDTTHFLCQSPLSEKDDVSPELFCPILVFQRWKYLTYLELIIIDYGMEQNCDLMVTQFTQTDKPPFVDKPSYQPQFMKIQMGPGVHSR